MATYGGSGYVSAMTREFAVTVPGGTITAWQQGDGPHVLRLTAGLACPTYTESLAAELEHGYTVTRYQQRGVAPSTTEGPFDVETHMATPSPLWTAPASIRPTCSATRGEATWPFTSP